MTATTTTAYDVTFQINANIGDPANLGGQIQTIVVSATQEGISNVLAADYGVAPGQIFINSATPLGSSDGFVHQ